MSLVLQQLDKDKPASFTIDGSVIQAHVKSISGLFKKEAEVLIAIYDGAVYVAGFDNAKSGWVKTDASDVSGQGCFIIIPDIFCNLVNKRGELKFDVTNQLEYKALKGRFKGNLSIQTLSNNTLMQANIIYAANYESVALPNKTYEEIADALVLSNLNDVYSETPTEFVRVIAATETALKVVTYSPYHSALVEVKLENKIKSPFTIAVYQSYFDNISSLAKGSSFKFAISSNYFCVIAKNFFLSLPPVQYSETEFELVGKLIADMIAAEKVAGFSIESEKLIDSFKSICSIYEPGSKIQLDIKDEKATFSLATSYGAVTESVKAKNQKGECSIGFDAPPLQDIIKFIPKDSCKLTVLDGKAYLLSFSVDNVKAHYIISLMQN